MEKCYFLKNFLTFEAKNGKIIVIEIMENRLISTNEKLKEIDNLSMCINEYSRSLTVKENTVKMPPGILTA